ncbi:DMT family transporter [Anaerobacillus alkaliphilus]|uniref:DMT family transporter n=1 Tax=Anaerobacillus alkaliphilus TaxID=1548597 RepID=A0A4Q0VXE7_9BACI|nr:DMT family transporter [Anaerobacillus alkaliphilus]RXJ04423.1 DMT family transporter [Anaerobacillus alkaliphilus]
MSKLLFIILSIVGGVLAGVQASINGELGKRVGGLEASLISFFIGTLFLVFIVLFFGKGQIHQIFTVPKWQLLGGFLGAVFVTVIILSIPHTGVALTIFAAIIGQMLISLTIDHFGFLGIQAIPMNWSRVFGLLLMLAGLFFIYRGSITQ